MITLHMNPSCPPVSRFEFCRDTAPYSIAIDGQLAPLLDFVRTVELAEVTHGNLPALCQEHKRSPRLNCPHCTGADRDDED